MKRVMAVLLMLTLFASAALAEEESGEITLYVSPAGHDENDGQLGTPLRTLHEAMQRLKKDKSKAPATIWLHGGIHRFEETLSLDYRNRGSIAIRAMPDDTPIITGDTPISAWTETTLHGEAVWLAPFEGKTLRALYADGGARPNARWPKEGFLHVSEQATKTSSQFGHQRAFLADPADLPESLDGAFVRLLHWWKDELSAVRGYDAKSGKVTLNRPSSMTIRQDDRFWLENVLSAPLEPGEWAHDTKAGLLYYAPLPGETPYDTVLYAGTLERLITIDGLSGITFEGITFSRSGWSIPLRDSSSDFPQAAYDAESAIWMRNGRDIAFTRCTFLDLGGGAIRLDAGIKDAAIISCTFENIGAQALYIRGRNTRETESVIERLRIENNHIKGYGHNFLNAPAILLIHARDANIRHNEIHDGAYTAISAGWVWGTGFNITDGLHIEENLIYDIGHGMLADMGGVYTLGVQKSTVIAGNVIYNVRAAEYGGWGIYLDEGASGILVEQNLVYGCSSQGFHQHNGVTNTIRNNIFAYNEQGQVGASDKRARGTFLLSGNLLVGEEPFLWRKYEKEKIDLGENLFFTEASPFADLSGPRFSLVDDARYAEIGFIPWDSAAGRE